MRLAVNFSHEAARLLEQGRVEFDYWKCTTPGSVAGPELTKGSGKPCYVHFPFDAGKEDLLETDWDAVQRTLDETGTHYVNVHLNAKRSDFQHVEPDKEWTAVRERFLVALSHMADRFGGDRIIAENVIYRGEDGPYLRASVEPELITEVINEIGCGLLLDTAHASISSEQLGLAPADYIAALPVAKIAELHVTGTAHDGARRRDSVPMTAEDWQVAEWVLQHLRSGEWRRPWIVALEYGGIGPSYDWRSDPDVIAAELPRLASLLTSM